MKSSPIASNQRRHKTGNDKSPQSPRLSPPMLEVLCSLDHDDNISDYTESVFLMRGVMQQQQSEKSLGSGRYMKGAKERTGNRDWAGSGGLSVRFTPVYVGSEAVNKRSGEN